MTLNNTIIIPSLSGSSILSCLERGGGGELFCLGRRIGRDYDFFLFLAVKFEISRPAYRFELRNVPNISLKYVGVDQVI